MKDKTLFVTGGNAGIGLATALLFAKNGANIALLSRREDENQKAKAKIEALGAACLTFTGSTTDAELLSRAYRETYEHFGGLHYCFNNAGVNHDPKPITEQTEYEYQHVMDVNVKGVWLCLKHQLPWIEKSGGGAVVNTSSVAGLIGINTMPIYSASKAAVNNLTKSVALEYATRNVRINALCPGYIVTEMTSKVVDQAPEFMEQVKADHPMGRVGQVDECARAVLYLCRDATFTTGHMLTVDGGHAAD